MGGWNRLSHYDMPNSKTHIYNEWGIEEMFTECLLL